ncbi:UBC-like protein [Xylariaceae sp. AK1471]|nr:UBC-like protein [Xylariaceae sp. AK1471]
MFPHTTSTSMAFFAIKRVMSERAGLEEENPDYKVFFQDDNLLSFDAYVAGPDDSLYRHKLLKLHFEIPELYPMVPPKVTFIQHSGGRVHPNLYLDGTVCLSILGTWPGEQWTSVLCIHTVLISIRALLDNEPYRHEPERGNDPEYNKFVQFTTWRALLIDYAENEMAKWAQDFVKNFVRERSARIMEEIFAEKEVNKDVVCLSNPYSECVFRPNYDRLIMDMRAIVSGAMM